MENSPTQPPRMNGAESLVHTLIGNGLKVCFANPGTSEMHFVAALDRIPGLRCIPGQQENVELGRITLTNFANPAGLEALGGNLYRATGASGEAQEGVPGEEGMGAVKQFTLEASNVNVVEEMVDMITTQRAYEMNAKVVSSADQMLKFITQAI